MLALLSDGPSETFIIRILRVPFGTTTQTYSATFSLLQNTSLQLLDRSRRGYQIDSCLVAFAEECRGNALIRLLPISSFEFNQLRPSGVLALLSDDPSETFIIRIRRDSFNINKDTLNSSS